jgi:hypothetical protein
MAMFPDRVFYGVRLALAAAIVTVVLDLDRPGRGRVQMNMTSMAAVRESMSRQSP